MKGIQKRQLWLTGIFLLIEAFLYARILIADRGYYAAIVVCFVHALLMGKHCQVLVVLGLGFTVLADLCLVVCQPIQQLWGMVFFLGTQTAYAFYLKGTKPLFWVRLGVILVAEAVTIAVLGANTDALALVSLCYYANLILNILVAFSRKKPLFSLALVLFLLCDTVIGLQVMANQYLPLQEGGLLERLLYPGFNLAWLFYLPSQVLLSICAYKKA